MLGVRHWGLPYQLQFPRSFLLTGTLTFFSWPRAQPWEVNHIWFKPTVVILSSWTCDWSRCGHVTQLGPKGNSVGGFWERISSLIRKRHMKRDLFASFLPFLLGHCCVKRWWVSNGSHLVTLGDQPEDKLVTYWWWWGKRVQRTVVLYDNFEMPNTPQGLQSYLLF